MANHVAEASDITTSHPRLERSPVPALEVARLPRSFRCGSQESCLTFRPSPYRAPRVL